MIVEISKTLIIYSVILVGFTFGKYFFLSLFLLFCSVRSTSTKTFLDTKKINETFLRDRPDP